MPFVKGYKQTGKHQEKAKRARRVINGFVKCVCCGEKFGLYVKKQKTCGKKECKQYYDKLKYEELKKTDPITSKASILFSTVRLGRGKREKSLKILNMALGCGCKYCGEIITLENASVDHKTPRLGRKVYNRKKKKMIFTYAEIKELDKEENLHIICRDCNQRKSTFTHGEYVRLLDFLNQNTDIKEKVFYRFNLGRLFFGKKTKRA